jgi:O-antigen/teichoic acid export membrane protein
MPKNLTDHGFRALKWNYLGVAARIGAQFIATLILARILGPQAFGLFAATVVVTGFASIVIELGLGAALIQKPDLTPDDIRHVFTWLVAAGGTVAGAIVLAAPWLSSLFGDPSLTTLLFGAASYVLFYALGSVSSSLLRRKFDMKAVQIAMITSYVAGFIGYGIPAALLGLGAWSLIGALNVQAIINTVILYAHVRHPVRPLFRTQFSALHQFGMRIVPTNLLNWVIEYMDNLLVGRLLGMDALGLYSVSYNLARTPTNHVVTTLQSVLFPASARLQNEMDKLRRVYLALVSIVTLVTIPVFVCVGGLSLTVILGLYGEQWRPAASLLLPLALAMPLHSVLALAGPILWGKGQVGRELKVQFWIAIVMVVCIVAATSISLAAVGWAVFLVYCARAIWLTREVLNMLNIPWRELYVAMRGGLILAGVTTPLLLIANEWFADMKINPAPRLVLDIVVASVIYASAAFTLRRVVLSSHATWVLAELTRRSPSRIRVWLNRYLPQSV